MNRTVKICRNENGSTLIVVLLVIAVFSVLGLTLIGVSLAHSQQTNQSTYQVQATNAAEMGLKAYDQKISEVLLGLNNNVPSSFNTFKATLDSDLPTSLDSNQGVNSMQDNPQYEVIIENESFINNEVQFLIKSTGMVQGVLRTITQNKVFNYTPPGYMGLSLPHMSGSLIHAGDLWCSGSQTYINGQLCTNDTTHQTVDLTSIKGLFINMPLTYPQNQPINGASTVEGSNVVQSEFDTPVNFNSQLNLKSSEDSIVFNDPVYVGGSINTGGTFKSVDFNKAVAINGDINAGQAANYHFKDNVYINGNLNISDGASVTFDRSVYIMNGNLNLHNTGSVYFGGNVHMQTSGQLNGTGSATFVGNLYINSDFNSSGNDLFEGYVFVNGSFNNSGQVTFDRTVYVQGNFFPKGKGTIANFTHGVVTAGGTASPSTNGNGKILIGPIQSGGNDSGSDPVTVTTINTNYQ
ncbi:hypothetical protein E4665_04165 [Sporolactobacillus shoreae]|uniref:Type 4 fimbrial biogenesis protein PilX N-terminal domain-containing protein n=1 Tax=Sporolactobacillus shoreae TaxID=1465501 RepID=A0A4Z0GTC4_9BACL|nr:type II secretion system protein [Sporolactobacillus shoreae]TGA99526.1 hypothetical protein E4665_04165 [Sporolactobacillus shoreae]